MGFAITGLNHLGLVVEDIDQAKKWFVDILGLKMLEDRGELVFLLAGQDIIAIKTPRMAVAKPEYGGAPQPELPGKREGWQTLDHYGFYAPSPAAVDSFAGHLRRHGVEILKGPYDRRDGRSVYFRDPCGLVGEYLYWVPAEAAR